LALTRVRGALKPHHPTPDERIHPTVDPHELEKWVEHLDRCGVPHTVINDMPYASVVVLRDPDNIQLELFA
jgi:hypothetical protein